MFTLPCFDEKGTLVRKITFDENLFGTFVRKRLLKEVIVLYEKNKRKGTASTKTRKEVKGSTRKPWKQKHTGRARSGTVRSPLWRKGGVIFGPKPRDYYTKIPDGKKQGALDSSILSKLFSSMTYLVEDITLDKPSTKRLFSLFKNLKLEKSCLFGTEKDDRNLHLSARNLPNISLTSIRNLNAYDVLKHRNLLFTFTAFKNLVASRGGNVEVAEASLRNQELSDT